MKSIIKSKRRAFTLVELLVALAVSSIVLIAVCSLMIYTARSFAGILNYTELDSKSRRALDLIVRDIRQVDYVSQYSTNEIHFQWIDPSDGASKELVYVYDSAAKVMKRFNGGVVTHAKLLEDCSPISGHSVFEVFSRVPSSDPWQPWSVSSGSNYRSNVKAVRVQWVCSRRVLGVYNSESVQTTMIVMRNQ